MEIIYFLLLLLLIQGYSVSLSATHIIIGLIISFIFVVISLWFGIPQKLAKGYKEVSDLEQRKREGVVEELDQIERKLKQSKEEITDLMRELDYRREINIQDTKKIKSLLMDIERSETTIIKLRETNKFLEGELESSNKVSNKKNGSN
jgi:hypothetical protein